MQRLGQQRRATPAVDQLRRERVVVLLLRRCGCGRGKDGKEIRDGCWGGEAGGGGGGWTDGGAPRKLGERLVLASFGLDTPGFDGWDVDGGMR